MSQWKPGSELNSDGDYAPERTLRPDTHEMPRPDRDVRIDYLQAKSTLTQGQQMELDHLLRQKWGA
jgi:hypothetical protein